MSTRMMTGRRGSQEVVFVVASKGKAIGGLDVAFVVGGGDLPAVEGFAGFGVAGYQRGDVDGLGGAVGRGEGLGEMDVGDAVLVKASRPKSPGIVAQRRLDGLLNVHQFVQFFVLLLPSHQFLCRGLAAPVIATTPPMRPLHPLAGLEGDLPRVDVAEAVGAVAFRCQCHVADGGRRVAVVFGVEGGEEGMVVGLGDRHGGIRPWWWLIGFGLG
mmetsp:Transcript_16353/g.34144  ORF Transcript_16353/g.34144 Transcript_16353/m.34144 type:complete len:214 (-) Transcript_16353:66-707(-)